MCSQKKGEKSRKYRIFSPKLIDRFILHSFVTKSCTGQLEAKFVLITKNPSNSLCDISPVFSRVRTDNAASNVDVYVTNHAQMPLELRTDFEIAMARWKK